jgi:AhpD family alkylhydroperoxidase
MPAMSSIAPLTRAAANESQRKLFDAIEGHYGKLLDPVAVTAHNPAMLDAMLGFERNLARADRLPERLKQLVNLKVAALLGCPFCIDIGSHLAHQTGVTRAELLHLANYRASDAFSASERCAFDIAEIMTTGDGELDEATWRTARQHFDDAALVELFGVIAWENYRSRFNRAAGLQAQGFCSVGERAPSERGPVR